MGERNMQINDIYWMMDDEQFPLPIKVTILEIAEQIKVVDNDGDEWVVDKDKLFKELS